MLDNIKIHFEDDFKSAGQAIELWLKYERVVTKSKDWMEVDEFLAELSEAEQHLLDVAIKLNQDKEKTDKLAKENIQLKTALLYTQHPTVEATTVLTNGSSQFIESIRTNKLADSIEAFINAKKTNGSARSSIAAYEFAINQLAFILEGLLHRPDLDIADLTIDMMRRYTQVLPKFPSNHSIIPELAKISPHELVSLVEKNDAKKLLARGFKPYSKKTVDNRFTIVREFLRFLENQQYPIQKGLTGIVKFVGRGGQSTPPKRRRFNDNELQILFESTEYNFCKFKRPSDYWVPLLALFTGATQSELLQLHVSDVYETNKIWIIDINAAGEKQLKNTTGRSRQVPIHSQLIALGFDRFVKKQKNAKHTRLFPDEERNNRGQFSSYSKRFNRFRSALGIGTSDDEKVDFHSFRHTVSTVLIGLGCEEGIVNDIIGHESGIRSETRRTYSEGAFIEAKQKIIEKLKYGIDFNYTKFWR